MISVRFQDKPFNIMVLQVYAPTSNTEEAEWFYENLQDPLELTPPKDVLCITGGWNAKGSQEMTGRSDRQVCPWSIKGSRAKVNSFSKGTH